MEVNECEESLERASLHRQKVYNQLERVRSPFLFSLPVSNQYKGFKDVTHENSLELGPQFIMNNE